MTTNTELYQVLEYYRHRVQCARIQCFQNNLPLSNKECKNLGQIRQLPIVLPVLRSHLQTTFPLLEKVDPTGDLSILTGGLDHYIHPRLTDKYGPANNYSADGYLARCILTTCLALVNLFDELHPYSLIFSIHSITWIGAY